MSPTPNANDTDNHDLELCDHVTANNKNKTKSLKMYHTQFASEFHHKKFQFRVLYNAFHRTN